MDDKKRKRLYLAGALIVAVTFLTSYLAFGNNNTASGLASSTTTQPCNGTVFVTGSANGIITGYSSSVLVVSSNTNSLFLSKLGTYLSALQANGSIVAYQPYPNSSFGVYLSAMGAYQLAHMLRGFSNDTATIATEHVTLPSPLVLYYFSQPVEVYMPVRNYSVVTGTPLPINALAALKVGALVDASGRICNNEVSVSAT